MPSRNAAIRAALAADPQQHALAVVENFAGKAKFVRHTPDCRPETDALDSSPNADFERLERFRSERSHDFTSSAA